MSSAEGIGYVAFWRPINSIFTHKLAGADVTLGKAIDLSCATTRDLEGIPHGLVPDQPHRILLS
jgi:hypothetical protein